MTSNGLVHNSGRRKGSIAMYLQPWHPDIFDFLSLRYNNPPEELRARDIFLALWTPDIFMKRVEADDVWSLFCPSVVPKLADTYGEEFDKIYIEAEKQKLYFKQVKAREVWDAVLRAQEETGLPYMLFKDNVNNKSNQKNIGIIRSSNLCVSGDTKILTKKYGYREIKELEDTYEELWNGYEWSNSLVKKTSESSKLLKICFSDGSEIKCTKEHKFIVPSGDKVDAQELKIGHKIMCVPSLPNNGTDLSIYKDRKVSTQTKTEAQNLKMLYQTYGVNPHIKNIDDNYELVFSEQDSQKLLEFGIIVEPTRDFDFDIYVVSITEQEEEPTWCFGEPLRNQGMFNGILAGNCTEIVEYTDKNSVAVCNLASIALPKYVYYDKDNTPKFNFKDLGRITEMITENLNLIIDKNFYPVKEAETKR
jgi:ribonucleotide reductase alpha subunit